MEGSDRASESEDFATVDSRQPSLASPTPKVSSSSSSSLVSASVHETDPSSSSSRLGSKVLGLLTKTSPLPALTPAPLPALPIEMHPVTSAQHARQQTSTGSSGANTHEGPYRDGDHSRGADDGDANDIDEEDDALDELTGGYTPYIGRLTAVACLGGLQFGIDTGIISGMLIAVHNDLGHPLSAAEQEIIVSATTVGAIVGALSAGRLGDWAGRKKVMILAGVFFALGSIEQAASQVVRELVLGRLLVGLGVGMASMIVPTYLGECAPPSIRGRIVGINSLLITGGQVIAYSVDAALYNVPHGWRWMVLAGGIPAVAQLIGLIYLDESPRWLISRGRHVAARHVLQRIYPLASTAAITAQVSKIERNLARRQLSTEEASSLPTTQADTATQRPLLSSKTNAFKAQIQMLLNEPANRKALMLACGLQACQQLIGANSILYYSSRLLLMAGFQTNPNVAAIWVAVANFVGTVIAMRLVDRVGRRTLLLRATAAATVALACLAIALGQIDTGDVTDGVASTAAPDGSASAWAYISLVAMVFFLFFYALGLGTVPWLVQSEIFSGNVRDVGGGLATATNWSMNLLTSATFLDLVRVITPQGSFWLYAGVGVITWTFTYTQLPELMGVSIDDVQAALVGAPTSSTSGQARPNSGYVSIREQDTDEDEGQG